MERGIAIPLNAELCVVSKAQPFVLSLSKDRRLGRYSGYVWLNLSKYDYGPYFAIFPAWDIPSSITLVAGMLPMEP